MFKLNNDLKEFLQKLLNKKVPVAEIGYSAMGSCGRTSCSNKCDGSCYGTCTFTCHNRTR